MSEAKTSALMRNWWAVALRGLFGVLFGLVALLMPGATMLSLVLLFAVYMAADGISAIVSAVRAARRDERWGGFLLEGIVDLVAGAAAFLWPAITVFAFVMLVAAWALISGALMLWSAFSLSRTHGRGWLIVAGLASVVYGALLIVAPLIGAIVLTWWIGAYALVFGIALLVLAFRLRGHRPRPGLAQPA